MGNTTYSTVIVGLGITGLSCVRYFARRGITVAVVDSRQHPPCLEQLQQEFPDVSVVIGTFDTSILESAQQLVVSPGVSLQEPAIAAQQRRGADIIGDIELFVREAKAPIIAITGSNGKTTVTTLMGQMVKDAKQSVVVCGNIGEPVLDALEQTPPDCYVMELSSFQLETTQSLKARAAVVLNVCPDHMDRYASFEAYKAAKQSIYNHCDVAVVNSDEPDIWQDLKLTQRIGFTQHSPKANQFGLEQEDDDVYLAHGKELLMPVKNMALQGQHHCQNAVVALALGSSIGLPMDSMLHTLQHFSGLVHRCQWVRHVEGVDYYNDSKATNVGAVTAALHSVGGMCKGQVILIAGGDGKSADFTPLQQPVSQHVSHVILLGQDAMNLHKTLAPVAPIYHVESLGQAVQRAAQLASPGDAVLLSPACASFDMFNNYEHRGDVFMQLVGEL